MVVSAKSEAGAREKLGILLSVACRAILAPVVLGILVLFAVIFWTVSVSLLLVDWFLGAEKNPWLAIRKRIPGEIKSVVFGRP